jgi:hypothetical protein
MQNLKRKTRPFVYRALFVVNHPDLDQVMICRSVFRRSFMGFSLPSLDECGPKASLHEAAKRAVAYTFPKQPVNMRTGKRFQVDGLTSRSVRTTVYMLSSPTRQSFLLLGDDYYIQLDENHPSYEHIASPRLSLVRTGMG